MGGSDALSGCASGAGGESMEPWAPRAVIPVPRHGNPSPFPHGPPTRARPSPRHPPLQPPPFGLLPTSRRHSRAPTRESMPLPARIAHYGEAPGATSAPPSNAPISLPCLLKDPRNTRRWRPGPSARFTSKCRKMSQNVALFHTPTRRMSLLRVKNLTFLAKTRPFWSISVHFAPVRPPPPRGGGLRRGNSVQRFPSALGGASPPTPGPLPLRAGGTRRGAV